MLPSFGHQNKRATFRLSPSARSGILMESYLLGLESVIIIKITR
jgi:hypothetical protein